MAYQNSGYVRGQYNQSFDKVIQSATQWNKNLKDAVVGEVNKFAPVLVDYAKNNHVFQNRTGIAESNIHTQLEVKDLPNGAEIYLHLAHGAIDYRGHEYGFFIETMQGGRFAVLMPTIINNAQYLINVLQQL